MFRHGFTVWQAVLGTHGPQLNFAGSVIVPEDTATSSSLGTFAVSGGSGTYTFAITAGNGAGKFSISTATLVLAGALNYESVTSYGLTITANNGVDPILTLNLTINVGNVAEKPVNTVLPVITGSPASGATLSVSTGTWTDQSGATYAYRWLADAVAIGGATSSTFLLTDTQIGAVITAGVIATNSAAASDEAVSLGTSAVSSGPDITAPTISTVALTSSAGGDNAYKAGDVVSATVTFSENVTVVGTPQLTLTVGASGKTANYASGSGTTALIFSYTVQAGDTDTNGISIGANALALNSGTIRDAAANNATLTHSSVADQSAHKVDTTAPSLSSQTDTKTGSTTADLVVTTDSSDGTLYAVATTSGTTPTKAQVKAGQDNGGSAATFAGSQSISSTGAKTINATGLTASTAYTGHFMHEDAAGNQSTVVSGDGFTTDVGASFATLNPLDKSGVTLSGGNLTATYGAAAEPQVRSTASHTTGKYHCEVTVVAVTSAGFPLLGVATGAHAFGNYIGSDHSVGMTPGDVAYPGITATVNSDGDVITYAAGDVLAIEVDLDAGFLYFQNFTAHPGFYNRGSAPATPIDISSITGSPVFLAIGCHTAGDSFTVNFGATAYAVTPTSGYGNW